MLFILCHLLQVTVCLCWLSMLVPELYLVVLLLLCQEAAPWHYILMKASPFDYLASALPANAFPLNTTAPGALF